MACSQALTIEDEDMISAASVDRREPKRWNDGWLPAWIARPRCSLYYQQTSLDFSNQQSLATVQRSNQEMQSSDNTYCIQTPPLDSGEWWKKAKEQNSIARFLVFDGKTKSFPLVHFLRSLSTEAVDSFDWNVDSTDSTYSALPTTVRTMSYIQHSVRVF